MTAVDIGVGTRVGLPSSAGALSEVAGIGAAMARLAAQVTDARRWPDLDRRRMLDELDRVVDGLSMVRATVLVAERDSGEWHGAGDRSFEAWRARTSRAGQRAAVAQVRQAERLAAVPSAVAAVTEGRLSAGHAAVIGAVAATGTPVQRDAVRSEAQQLMALAETQDAGTFATTVARWAASVDPAALEADHQAQRSARYLSVSTTPRGTLIKGQLDDVAGHRLTLALEALSPRPAAEDDRDPGQRRADALDTMAGRILALADTKPGGHVPPQISLILTADTWLATRADRDRRRAQARAGAGAAVRRGTMAEPSLATAVCADAAERTDGQGSDAGTATGIGTGTGTGTGGATGDGAAGYLPATLEDGTAVAASELAAAMCDCEITRIVIDADGVPLDVGRAQRVFTGLQRRAVIARDRECAWPECHAHARWCEVHHIAWWERDTGPTSVENGVLLCSFHHHEVHRRDLAITRVPPQASAGPPRSLLAGSPAVVGYEFRDAAGRVVGQAAAARPSPIAEAQDIPPPLEWATDPMTGARTPTLFLTG
ncbi:HNH endonuclease [Cellulomonas aerilata]|uniref:HNH nuclease domain-containing protein n=1 Tax=Cellulomonas aerilata TaxID=515326 RepID=A0A512DDS1_9CELL|nr:DUF222 domain-containing protein [Cellulomonas aerilata]GEO34616.1 hypothetical protein CAE01nite_23410 [Cellulomonas aerilata]